MDNFPDIRSSRGAFEAFYREHVEDVQRFVARRVSDPHEAADLTSDIVLAVIESSQTFSPKLGPARAWLFWIARNVVANGSPLKRLRHAAGAYRTTWRHVIEAFIALANAIIVTRRLIRAAWTTHRWDARPTRLTAATRNCPEAATKLPGSGHQGCPLAVMGSARHEFVCLAASRG